GRKDRDPQDRNAGRAAAGDLPDRGGHGQEDRAVRIVMAEDVDLLEPCMSTQSTIGAALLQNISETLTYLDVGGCGGLQPKLAESREQLPDGSWRFELRQGVTFSDGTPFDARDVKHSF